MYARQVTMQLKPNTRADYTKKLESEIIPMLRKQKGFQDEISFSSPTDRRAFAVSLWDTKESAEAYNKGSYAEVTKLLSSLVDGTPEVRTYEVLRGFQLHFPQDCRQATRGLKQRVLMVQRTGLAPSVFYCPT
jgi:heme-degrading monooxygenase HmoA